MGRPCDYDCEFAIALGKKWKLVDVDTAEEAQNAYRRRIQWMYWLKKITEQKQPLQRAEALLSSFDAFFDPEAIAALPTFVLARLVGVFEGTMAQVHRQHYEALGIVVPEVAEPNRYWYYVEFPHPHDRLKGIRLATAETSPVPRRTGRHQNIFIQPIDLSDIGQNAIAHQHRSQRR